MSTADWNFITQTLNPKGSYNIFINKFLNIYDEAFRLHKTTVKMKNRNSPWITKGIKQQSRKKQHLYEKFLKNKTIKRLETYKQYKTLFEKIRKSLKSFTIKRSSRNMKIISKLLGKF